MLSGHEQTYLKRLNQYLVFTDFQSPDAFTFPHAENVPSNFIGN